MQFLGIDVSKDKLDGAAVSENSGAMLGRRSFPNTPDGIERLVRWAEKLAGVGPAGIHAILEATAAYQYPASAPHVDLRPLGRAIVSGGVLKRGAASWQTSGYLYGVPAG